jgi:hypothetical protein
MRVIEDITTIEICEFETDLITRCADEFVSEYSGASITLLQWNELQLKLEFLANRMEKLHHRISEIQMIDQFKKAIRN